MTRPLPECEWLERDEFCTNDECPYCTEWCPVTEHPEICKYYEAVDKTLPFETEQ